MKATIQSPFWAKAARGTRLTSRRIMNAEWEADLWAMCFLFTIGDAATLNAYLNQHPEKTNLYLLAATGCIYKRLPQIINGFCQKLFSRVSLS